MILFRLKILISITFIYVFLLVASEIKLTSIITLSYSNTVVFYLDHLISDVINFIN